jgi:integrase
MARREYQDSPLKKTAGLNPRWYIRVRKRVIGINGQPKRSQTREYLGFCKEMGIRQAQQARQAKLSEINNQIYSISSHVLLKEFVLLFNEKHVPTLGKATQDKYRHQLTNHIVPEFGLWKLVDITTEQIQAFLNRCEGKGLSWWTRNDLRNILSGLFTKAADWGYWTERNPVERTSCGRKKAKREKRVLSDQDTARLIDALPEPCRLIALVCASTGMRVSEALGLKWKNVDLASGWMQIRERHYRGDQDITKTDKSRRDLPLGSLIHDFAQMRMNVMNTGLDDYVFQSETGGPLEYSNLRYRHLVPVAKKLGLYFEGFGFHSLRRGLITGVQEVGGSSIEAQMLAGHSRPDMTSEYSVTSRRRKEELIIARQERLKGTKSTNDAALSVN